MNLRTPLPFLLSLVLASLGGGGCASDAEQSSDDATAGTDGPSRPGWSVLGDAPGATTRSLASASGEDVLVIFGGCGASNGATQGFAEALAKASTWRKAPKHLYAIRWTSSGCGYNGQFKNSKLGPLVLARAGTAGRVTVIAHSSGAYLAHEFLAQAVGAIAPGWDPAHNLRGRLAYFNLDGGGDANLTAIDRSAEKFPIFFVGARDATANINSRNYATMKALGGNTRFVEVNANGSGCTAYNCMHDALITTIPHNKKSFLDAQGTSMPLWCDYSHFPSQPDATCAAKDEQAARASSRAVVSSYLTKISF